MSFRMGMVVAWAALFAVGMTVGAHAQRDGKLVEITTKNVDVSGGSETIDLSGEKNGYKAIRLSNEGAAIKVENVRVNYADGSVHNERRSFKLGRGERTRPIDPRNSGKVIDSIVITYKPAGDSKRTAEITVWGVPDPAMTRVARDKEPQADRKGGAEPKDQVKSERYTSRARCVGGGSVLLGTTTVAPGVDRDVIQVGSRIGKFDELRLCAADHDVELIGVRIHFANGTSADLPYAGLIKAGYRTEGIPLKADQFIDRVELTYRRRTSGGAASVEVWGRVSEKWLDEDGRRENDGWVRLTSGSAAGFVGFDVDRTEVARHKKGFDKVRVAVRNRAITLDYVVLKFADGQEQKFDAKKVKVEPDRGYGPLDIAGGPKVIREIEARYRSRFFDPQAKGKENAVVEFWAR